VPPLAAVLSVIVLPVIDTGPSASIAPNGPDAAFAWMVVLVTEVLFVEESFVEPA
jgi:hypothetical protein